MKILVIGGTGLVGSYLLPKLVNKGHIIYAITRDFDKISKINDLGAIGITGDIRKPEDLKNSLPEKPDFMVTLAMPNVRPGHRMTPQRKAELRTETNDFFRNSIRLATEFQIPLILPGGTSYKTSGDEIADETWPIRRAGITEIGADTDEMVHEAIRSGNPKIIQLIFGKIYGNGGLFRFIYNMAKKRRSMIIGKGDNYVPNIHADDAAEAVVLAIEKQPFGEKFIIADDTPVTQKDFNTYMAELMHHKKPGHIPGFIIRWLLGKDFYEVIKMNCKVSNEKAKRMLGWQAKYKSYKEGLNEVIPNMEKQKGYFE